MTRRAWVQLFLAGCAIALGIALSLGPWRAYLKQRQETEASLQDMRRIEQARAELTRKKSRLEGNVGKEEAAREMGFKRPGEIPAESTP